MHVCTGYHIPIELKRYGIAWMTEVDHTTSVVTRMEYHSVLASVSLHFSSMAFEA